MVFYQSKIVDSRNVLQFHVFRLDIGGEVGGGGRVDVWFLRHPRLLLSWMGKFKRIGGGDEVDDGSTESWGVESIGSCAGS